MEQGTIGEGTFVTAINIQFDGHQVTYKLGRVPPEFYKTVAPWESNWLMLCLNRNGHMFFMVAPVVESVGTKIGKSYRSKSMRCESAHGRHPMLYNAFQGRYCVRDGMVPRDDGLVPRKMSRQV